MNWSKMLRLKLSITVLAIGFLFLAAACGGESASTDDLSVDELLVSAGEELAAMSTAKVAMIDETDSGAQFFGTTFKSMEAEIKSPDGFRMLVEVVAAAMGFVEIEMVAVGEQAYMKFSEDAPWLPLPLEQVPFNFGRVGPALSEALPLMRDAAITGREVVADAQTILVVGDIVSEDLSALITSLDPGHPITLTLWIDESEHILRQMRIDGRLYNDDAPGTRRLVTISGVNAPVDIQLPDIAAGP